MRFFPGQEVVCVNAGPLHGITRNEWLIEGQTYIVALHESESNLVLKGGGPGIYPERMRALHDGEISPAQALVP